MRIYYAKNAIVGSGHTTTLTGSSFYATMTFMAFSGSDTTSPADQQNGLGAGGFGDSAQGGSITPGQDNSLIITGCGWNTSRTMSVAGFTIYQTDYTGGVNYGGGGGWAIQTTVTATNPTWANSGGFAGAVGVANFKPSGGGGNDLYVVAGAQFARSPSGVLN